MIRTSQRLFRLQPRRWPVRPFGNIYRSLSCTPKEADQSTPMCKSFSFIVSFRAKAEMRAIAVRDKVYTVRPKRFWMDKILEHEIQKPIRPEQSTKERKLIEKKVRCLCAPPVKTAQAHFSNGIPYLDVWQLHGGIPALQVIPSLTWRIYLRWRSHSHRQAVGRYRCDKALIFLLSGFFTDDISQILMPWPALLRINISTTAIPMLPLWQSLLLASIDWICCFPRRSKITNLLAMSRTWEQAPWKVKKRKKETILAREASAHKRCSKYSSRQKLFPRVLAKRNVQNQYPQTK